MRLSKVFIFILTAICPLTFVNCQSRLGGLDGSQLTSGASPTASPTPGASATPSPSPTDLACFHTTSWNTASQSYVGNGITHDSKPNPNAKAPYDQLGSNYFIFIGPAF